MDAGNRRQSSIGADITKRVDDENVRADLLATLAFFGSLAYPALDVANLIGVDSMGESRFIEDVKNHGASQSTSRADILEVLGVASVQERSPNMANC